MTKAHGREPRPGTNHPNFYRPYPVLETPDELDARAVTLARNIVLMQCEMLSLIARAAVVRRAETLAPSP